MKWNKKIISVTIHTEVLDSYTNLGMKFPIKFENLNLKFKVGGKYAIIEKAEVVKQPY